MRKKSHFTMTMMPEVAAAVNEIVDKTGIPRSSIMEMAAKALFTQPISPAHADWQRQFFAMFFVGKRVD